MNKFATTEAVSWRCSVKKMFSEISQNSQENTCTRASFLIKLQVSAWNFIKKEALTQAFSCEFCGILKNSFFIEHLRWLHLPPVALWEEVYITFLRHAQLHERTGYDFVYEWVNSIDVLYHNSVLSVFGTRKIPSWSVPPAVNSPDQIPSNLTLTQTLTLTHVGIHRRGGIDQGEFSGHRFIKMVYLFNTCSNQWIDFQCKSVVGLLFNGSSGP